jgi:hypothetical protein
MTVRVEKAGGISTLTEREGGRLACKALRYGGMVCRVYREARPSLDIPYLEIYPTTIWVLVGQSSDNNVYSNVDWEVD